MIRDTFPWSDNVLVQVWDPSSGVELERFSIHNLMTNAGKTWAATRMGSNSVGPITHFAIGTGTTASSVAQTALVAEAWRDTVTSVSALAVGQAKFSYYLSSGTLNGTTLGEIGLFTAGVGGTMVARAVLTPTIAKIASKAVTFSWNITGV